MGDAKHPLPARVKRAALEMTELVGAAVENTLAYNPLLGARRRDTLDAAVAMARAIAASPKSSGQRLAECLRELQQVAAGKSDLAPDPKDRRFTDAAWRSHPYFRRLLQAHLATRKSLAAAIEESGIDPRNKSRAQFFAGLWADAVAPSNWLAGNPGAIRRAFDTGGLSLVRGMKHLVHDLRHNDGLPSQVDRAPFEVGVNIATTPGQVVLRTEMFELIQYAPSTPRVHARPLLMAPPQVNKFYCIDLTPQKSLAKWAVDSGVQFFVISWRNPQVQHGRWGLDDYVAAIDAAVEATRRITGSRDVNMWGSCSGGMTLAAYLGWLAAKGLHKVANVTWAVCILDTRDALEGGALGMFNTPAAIRAAQARSRRRGLVRGPEMAALFAWLRPNDLIWNYWVNNYLMGNDPPAHDILAWNSDTTNLPGRFHCDLLGLIEHNPYANPGTLAVAGEAIDLSKVKIGAYVVAGSSDHITPWRGCYRTARMFGPKTEFVLANAGHLQCLINPPGGSGSWFFSGRAARADADAWQAGARREEGSWWPHWREWIQRHSLALVPAPGRLGSRKYKPLAAAPGTYVMER
ncbi:MAG TPA: alpha/beta fold hydrolase [Ramlibacter sp.]|uniref:alpha/beta fold hydrolase n=1 Tax=Ramlibacter sp. TaxID=1917967 RepID=UPI002C791187|nr:alpha/beta fold hydrolase [Ramlibacter sp.]HVZ43641.1 alpha/beta fold hydrolase [Ramlibacter sp.]